MPRRSQTFGPGTTTLRLDGGTVLAFSPCSGSLTHFTAAPGGLRSIELPGDIDTNPRFENALREIGAYESETIHLDVPAQPQLRASGRPDEPDQIVIRPALRPEAGPSIPVILYQDESGGLSWHFANNVTQQLPEQEPARGLRSTATGAPTFIIPMRGTAARQAISAGGGNAEKLRGPITKWGRKIFKVLVLPVAAPLLEKPVQSIVGKIEQKYRSNLVWAPTPSSYQATPAEPFTDWTSLGGKRALLLVHGIFGSVEGMLSGLPRSFMEELHARYEGRVLAFNHLSVTASPEDNARFFLGEAKRAAPTAQLEFDILCHSHGGIVSRTLAERAAALLPDHNCRFRKVFFVATPNNGSALGDPEHMVDMLDVFTNLLTSFPDGPIMYSIEILLGIVKLLAYSSERSLPGLRAMGTKDYIQQVLNRGTEPSPARYAAATANYSPHPESDNGFFTGPFAQKIADRIFRQEAGPVLNDLVVPEQGVYQSNGHPSFPIANTLRFGASDHVWHSGFFRRPETLAAIRHHLEMPASAETAVNLRADRLSRGEETAQPLPPKKPSRGGLRGIVTDRAPWTDSPRSSPEADSDGASTTGKLEVRRFPRIDFPSMVVDGQQTELVVRLDMPTDTDARDGVLTLEIAEAETGIALSAILKAPGFVIVGEYCREMMVGRQRDAATETVSFVLKAKPPGARPVRRTITVEFWRGNDAIGEATCVATVVPADYNHVIVDGVQPDRAAIQIPAVRRQDCDLAIMVRGDGPRYELSLRCWAPGEEYPDKEAGILVFNAADLPIYTHQILDDKFQSYPAADLDDVQFDAALSSWNAEYMEYLRSFGQTLWQMLPVEFRNEYLRLRNSIRSMVVYSNDLVFPWELVQPHEVVDGKFYLYDFLGAGHVLGRWQPKLGLRPKQQRVAVAGFAVVRPRYKIGDLDWADDEVKTLRDMFPGAIQVEPVTATTINGLMNRNDIQLVHFTGHGDYQANSDLNALRLEDGNFASIRMLGTRLGHEAQPILYLNACSLGKTAPVPGRLGGFAANCLAGGWSGVIAPYWLINDESAARFSQLLYAKLKAHRSIGEALQELRAEHQDDPMFLAYSYVGDPWVRLQFLNRTPEMAVTAGTTSAPFVLRN